MFKAVIFDFDGVIGDTMEDNFHAWNKAFSKYNVQLSPIDYFLLEGMGRFEVARFFIEKYRLDPAIEESVVNAKDQNYIEKNKFKIYPEINSIFEFLNNKKVPIAMVTGASRERVERTLKQDFLKQIAVIVTVDDVKKGKPDPEPYELAVKKLNLRSQDCVVIENAKTGIASAKSAGCICFALETTLDRNYLQGADEIFATHNDLQQRLVKIFNQVVA